uniref:Ammonium_transp domain-containing protein n=1 Tax=Bursaphelenchus xylophilus TaxID=6326 RepID=A0A1I7SQF2_BURXY
MMFDGDDYARERLDEQSRQKVRDDVYKLVMFGVIIEWLMAALTSATTGFWFDLTHADTSIFQWLKLNNLDAPNCYLLE